MNLTIMKLYMALKVESSPKPTVDNSANKKKLYEELYEEWEYNNSCCLMIMENHM